jgi:hypothetical protein
MPNAPFTSLSPDGTCCSFTNYTNTSRFGSRSSSAASDSLRPGDESSQRGGRFIRATTLAAKRRTTRTTMRATRRFPRSLAATRSPSPRSPWPTKNAAAEAVHRRDAHASHVQRGSLCQKPQLEEDPHRDRRHRHARHACGHQRDTVRARLRDPEQEDHRVHADRSHAHSDTSGGCDDAGPDSDLGERDPSDQRRTKVPRCVSRPRGLRAPRPGRAGQDPRPAWGSTMWRRWGSQRSTRRFIASAGRLSR